MDDIFKSFEEWFLDKKEKWEEKNVIVDKAGFGEYGHHYGISLHSENGLGNIVLYESNGYYWVDFEAGNYYDDDMYLKAGIEFENMKDLEDYENEFIDYMVKGKTRWGTYAWHIERGIDYIHPEDLEDFKREVNASKVFECSETGEYITLKYNDKCYRVKEKLFREVTAPRYYFGETVKIKEKQEEAYITDIMWHYDKQEHFYFVAVQNKKRSRRYFESELDKIG